MATVLVAIAVMGIVMSALLPVWRHQAKREKEAELLFRLSQYARAIELFQRANQGRFPPNIDILVQQKFLRKKYVDPMTGEDFLPLYGGQQPPAGRGGQPQQAPQGAGIVRVVSRSKETAIRNHNGAATYDQWVATPNDAPSGPGSLPPQQQAPPPGAGGPGTPGQQGVRPPGLPGGGPGRGGPGRAGAPGGRNPAGGRGPGGFPRGPGGPGGL